MQETRWEWNREIIHLPSSFLHLKYSNQDREEEQEAFDGTTDSLVNLYRENQITYDEFTKLPEAELQRITDKTKDLHIGKERFFQIVGLY